VAAGVAARRVEARSSSKSARKMPGQKVREGRVELPRPFGHRILRLLRLGTDTGSTCRLVSSGVVLCHPVSFRREQAVSENGAVACTHVYVERCRRMERVVRRLGAACRTNEVDLHVRRSKHVSLDPVHLERKGNLVPPNAGHA